MDELFVRYSSFIVSASYSDTSYSSDEEDGGLNPRETQQVSFILITAPKCVWKSRSVRFTSAITLWSLPSLIPFFLF